MRRVTLQSKHAAAAAAAAAAAGTNTAQDMFVHTQCTPTLQLFDLWSCWISVQVLCTQQLSNRQADKPRTTLQGTHLIDEGPQHVLIKHNKQQPLCLLNSAMLLGSQRCTHPPLCVEQLAVSAAPQGTLLICELVQVAYSVCRGVLVLHNSTVL
jgi:hypothetical protein